MRRAHRDEHLPYIKGTETLQGMIRRMEPSFKPVVYFTLTYAREGFFPKTEEENEQCLIEFYQRLAFRFGRHIIPITGFERDKWKNPFHNHGNIYSSKQMNPYLINELWEHGIAESRVYDPLMERNNAYYILEKHEPVSLFYDGKPMIFCSRKGKEACGTKRGCKFVWNSTKCRLFD
jgi:hypothetical protein